MTATEPDVSKKQPDSESRWSKILLLGQKNPEAGFSGWLVIFTAFLCVLTGFNVWVLHTTDRTLYEQAIARDRGWILLSVEMVGAKFTEPQDPISLRLYHRNIGSAAVTQLTSFYKVHVIERANVEQNWREVLVTQHLKLDNPKCTEHSIPTILPGSQKSEANLQVSDESASTKVGFRTIDLQNSEVPKQGDVWWGSDSKVKIEKLKKTFVINGCSEYWSIKAGRTEFCQYLDTSSTLEPESWQLKECPTGNKLE